MAVDEAKHQLLEKEAEKILHAENLTLLSRVVHTTLCNEIQAGFELVGHAKMTVVFEVDPKP